MCQWADELRKRLDAGYEHGVPAMAEMVRTLTPQQLQRIERRYRKADEEFRDEFLQADPRRARRGVEQARRSSGPR